jgi:hypothetical protein
MASTDITSRPRRTLNSDERRELFREFKLGIFALSALVVLVVTLCWDRGGKAGAGARPGEARPGEDGRLVSVVWQPEAARGERPPERPRDDGGQNRDDGGTVVPPPPPPPPAPVPPVPPAPQYRNYTVQKGDISLRKIAARAMGDANKWRVIQEANPGLKPNRMHVGQILRIPLAEAGAAVAALPADSPRRAAGGGGMVLDSSLPQ